MTKAVAAQKELRPLTPMEQTFIEGISRGLTQTAAARVAGYTQPDVQAVAIMQRPAIRAEIDRLRKDVKFRMNLSREDVIEGMMDAARAASNSMELVAAWREIGRIIGAYEPIKVEHSHKLEESQARMRQLSDEELARLADMDGALEGDYEVVNGTDELEADELEADEHGED